MPRRQRECKRETDKEKEIYLDRLCDEDKEWIHESVILYDPQTDRKR